MSFNPEIHHRRSIRLRGYDYSEMGWYFVTMCVQNRIPIFGKIVEGKMILSPEGNIIRKELLRTESIRMNMIIDEWIIMPDHIHFIVAITKRDPEGRTAVRPNETHTCPTAVRPSPNATHSLHRVTRSLSSFIAQLKATTTKRIRSMNIAAKSEKVWQRNYFEKIIQSENALNNIRRYIQQNPEKFH